MNTVKVLDFSDWSEWNGAAEGSGRSEKIWLISPSGEIGLFKYPKYDPNTKETTTEHISEHLASQIGLLIGVETARVDIGVYNGRIGSMSYLARKPYEYLAEGIAFISGDYPSYNVNEMRDEDTGKYYSIEHIFVSTRGIIEQEAWIEMMLFDYLIGNADRHQSNWAVLVKLVDAKRREFDVRRCPLYDNGSSLCSYVTEEKLKLYLGNDLAPMRALVDSKSKSIIRIDGNNKKKPRHLEVAFFLLVKYSSARRIAKRIIERLDDNTIQTLMSVYSENLLSVGKRELIKEYLIIKVKMLKALLEGIDNNE